MRAHPYHMWQVHLCAVIKGSVMTGGVIVDLVMPQIWVQASASVLCGNKPICMHVVWSM